MEWNSLQGSNGFNYRLHYIILLLHFFCCVSCYEMSWKEQLCCLCQCKLEDNSLQSCCQASPSNHVLQWRHLVEQCTKLQIYDLTNEKHQQLLCQCIIKTIMWIINWLNIVKTAREGRKKKLEVTLHVYTELRNYVSTSMASVHDP